MTTLSKIIGSLTSSNQEITLALANLKFDFSLVRIEAPKEYLSISTSLSPWRRDEAEHGNFHRTARKLAALFQDVIVQTPTLFNKYGIRASEIASWAPLSISEEEARKTRDPSVLQDLTGIDSTSVWAAATSGPTAISVHLLACFLARMWAPAEAVSIWVELVSERKKDISKPDDAEFHTGPNILAEQIEITRQDIAALDASARAWLQIADQAKSRQNAQMHSVLSEMNMPTSRDGNTYRSIINAFNRALRALDSSIQGIPQATTSGEVVIGILAWHIYPDLFVAGGHSGIVRLKDPLVNATGVLTVGMESPTDSDARTVWSLPLAHYRFYGEPIHMSASHEATLRIPLSSLPVIVLGRILTVWRDVPGWKSFPCNLANGLLWFKRLVECLPAGRGLVSRYGNTACASASGLAFIRLIVEQTAEFNDEWDEAAAQSLFAFGTRRGVSWLPSLSSSAGGPAPFLGLSRLSTILPVLRTNKDRIILLRLVASRLRAADSRLVIRYRSESIRYELASILPTSSSHTQYSTRTESKHARWIVLRAEELHSMKPDGKSYVLPSWLAERLEQIESDGELCLAALQVSEGTLERITLGYGTNFQSSLHHLERNTEAVLLTYYTGDLEMGALFSYDALQADPHCTLTSLEMDYIFSPTQISPQDLMDYIYKLEEEEMKSGTEMGLFKACTLTLSSFLLSPEATLSPTVFSRPIMSAKWLKDYQNQCRLDTSSRLTLSRSQQFACITLFDSGLDLDVDVFEYAFAVASGGFIFIAEYLVTDPFTETVESATGVRRILGNIGRPGVSILVSPSNPKIRTMAETTWVALNFSPFNGELQDCFRDTNISASFTHWEVPISLYDNQGIDGSSFLMEAVLSVHDRGRWIADLDPRVLSPSKDGTSRITRVTCSNLEDCSVDAPNFASVSIENWDELFDLPENEICVVKACGNWMARLALTVVSAMLQYETILLPPTFCWSCCSRAISSKRDSLHSSSSQSSFGQRKPVRIVVILGTNVLQRPGEPQGNVTQLDVPVEQSLGQPDKGHKPDSELELAASIADEMSSSDFEGFDSSTSDGEQQLEPRTGFAKNRNRTHRDKDTTEEAFPGEPQRLREPLLHNPRAYYSRLCDLKATIYKKSAMARLDERTAIKKASARRFPQSQIPIADSDILRELGWVNEAEDAAILAYCSEPYASSISAFDEGIGDTVRPLSRRLFDMFESRNIVYLASANFVRLKRSNFIHKKITILVADSDRPGVACPVDIGHSEVVLLAQFFQSTVSQLAHAIRDQDRDLESIAVEAEHNLGSASRSLLETLGLRFESGLPDEQLSYALALVLDFGVVSYAHTHLEQPSSRHVQHEAPIAVPQYLDPELPLIFLLSRYRTSCLNGFFAGQSLWVFHSEKQTVEPPLSLSITIDAFADLWGPVWRVYKDLTEGPISHYQVGGGQIVPWHSISTHNLPSGLTLKPGERLCHFIPRKTSPPGEHFDSSETESSDIIDTFADSPLEGSETLLIGARKFRSYMKWSRCKCNIATLENRLKGQNQLRQLGTKASYNYVDQRTASLVGGYHGINFGGSVTVKRASGVSFKEVFFNRWEKQPATRDPEQLMNLWGVAVSLCTNNAERVSLFELLNTPSMRRHLTGYHWSNTQCKEAFSSVVESGDVNAFCKLWRRTQEWHEELGKVVWSCLQLLSHTGLDKERDEFAALWVSEDTTLPKLVLLKPSEHNWTKFLGDSEMSFTVAIVVEECLGSTFGKSRCGRALGKSALQTSLCINHEVDPSDQLLRRDAPTRHSARWKEIWDVSHLKEGSSFVVAPGTRLKTIEVLGRTRILLEWDLIWREAIREMVGIQMRQRPSHWEYTEVTEGPIRPVPVYLLSS